MNPRRPLRIGRTPDGAFVVDVARVTFRVADDAPSTRRHVVREPERGIAGMTAGAFQRFKQELRALAADAARDSVPDPGELAAVAEAHRPGGPPPAGDTYLSQASRTVYWVRGETTSNVSIDRARRAFIDVAGVAAFQSGDSGPSGDGWELVWSSAPATTASGRRRLVTRALREWGVDLLRFDSQATRQLRNDALEQRIADLVALDDELRREAWRFADVDKHGRTVVRLVPKIAPTPRESRRRVPPRTAAAARIARQPIRLRRRALRVNLDERRVTGPSGSLVAGGYQLITDTLGAGAATRQRRRSVRVHVDHRVALTASGRLIHGGYERIMAAL